MGAAPEIQHTDIVSKDYLCLKWFFPLCMFFIFCVLCRILYTTVIRYRFSEEKQPLLYLSLSLYMYVCIFYIYIYTHIAARFSRFSPHLPSSPPAGTSDAPKALSPADLYKLMGNTGSLDDAVPVSDSIVANVIREHQAWHEGFHPAVHPSVHLSFHPSIYLSIDPGIVSIYI